MEFQDIILVTVSCLGFISVCSYALSFFRWVWIMFLRPPKNLKEYGSWAIVTGSTDRIGKALALELASKGLHLVLIGRNPSKLEATADEIRGRYGEEQVQIQSIVIDIAACSGEEVSKKIEEGIAGLDVGILVNNAGVGYPYARFFHEVDLELMMSNIKVNAQAPTWVTRSVLRAMMKKKKGAIINIGSGSSVVLPSFPLVTIYASTKAYLPMFSKCLHMEYKHQGIEVQCQIPLFVATRMAKVKKTSFFIPPPEVYAKASLRWIGSGDNVCAPILSHSLQWLMLKAIPNALLDRYIFQYFLGMRKHAMKKEALRGRIKINESNANTLSS